MRRFFFIISFIFIFFNALSQNYNYRDKAQAIFLIAQETQWPDEYNLKKFKIYIFSSDTLLYKYLDTIIEAGREIKNKKIQLKYFKNFKDVIKQEKSEIILIDKDNEKYIDTIANKYNTTTLIITEDARKTNKFCVNFLSNDKFNKLFELNVKEAHQRGLIFSERLLLIGANEEVLRRMYRDTVRDLRLKIEDLNKQIYIIEEQQRIIDLKKEQLKLLEQEIIKQQIEADSLKASLQKIIANLDAKKAELQQKQKLLIEQEQKIEEEKQRFEDLEKRLKTKEDELKTKEQQIANVNKELTKAIKRIQTQADVIKVAILILMALFFTIYLYIVGRKKNKEIQRKNNEISKINEELKVHQKVIEEKNFELQQHIKEITWSLNYAKRLQLALLPTDDQMNKFFDEYFLIYKPKDIVSGDFYYINEINDYKIFAVGDCTGHGVAGGFLSIMSITTLHEILKIKEITQTGQALEMMRQRVKEMFKHFGSDNYHGLDMALCAYNTKNKTLQFSGAYNSIFIFSKGKIAEYKGTRNPIGNYPVEIPFETKEIHINKGDIIYLFTDGYYDQLHKSDGKKGKTKLSKNRFKKIILANANLPLNIQKQKLIEEYKKWSSNEEQTDDITILAVKLI